MHDGTGGVAHHSHDAAGDSFERVAHLFVYGTLRPGQSRWHHLERFVVDAGHDDAVAGTLYDTGLGYPAALFAVDGSGDRVTGRIVGRTYALLAASTTQALEHLDDVEGAVRGLYRRVVVRTEAGFAAFAYQGGEGLALEPIPSGDWLAR